MLRVNYATEIGTCQRMSISRWSGYSIAIHVTNAIVFFPYGIVVFVLGVVFQNFDLIALQMVKFGDA